MDESWWDLTTVSLEKELAEELIDMKLKFLQGEIQKILARWEYHSATDFLEHARNGTLEEAEDDAITLRHLLDQREELFQLRSSWSQD